MDQRNGLMVALVLAVCLLTPSLVGVRSTYACSCALRPSPVDCLSSAASVFSGKVVEIDRPEGAMVSSADPVKVTFEVYEVWKGPSNGTLVIYTPREGVSCGYAFQIQGEYLVYAQGEQLTTTICSNTKLLSEALVDISVLGRGTAPTEGPPQPHISSQLLTEAAILAAVLAALVTTFVVQRRHREHIADEHQ
jgi:hypothetical protein